MEKRYLVNKGKSEFVESKGRRFGCYAIPTKVICFGDNLADIADEYIKPIIQTGDIVFISEKMIACTEGRAYPIESVKCGFFAKFLSKLVHKSKYGMGLAMPETMQCAINEVGLPRILIAAAACAVGRIFGKNGWFYMVAGEKASGIDGPCSYTLPPYNKYVVLSPKDANLTAKLISERIGKNSVIIIDANDFGCNILGRANIELENSVLVELLSQNPLGQSTQCTPIGILRPTDENII